MPFEVVENAGEKAWISEGLLKETNFAAIDIFDYHNGCMLMKLFCQDDTGQLNELTYTFKNDSKTHNPLCRDSWPLTGGEGLTKLKTPEAAMMHTPLAAVVRYNTGTPTVHLFYLSATYVIREIVWYKGNRTNKSLGISASPHSNLSATKWDAGKNIRLFYQRGDDFIAEHRLDENGNWSAGNVVGQSLAVDPTTTPTAGTALAFINMIQAKPSMRGFFQTKEGAIREYKLSDCGTKWTLSDFSIPSAPYCTPIAALVTKYDEKAVLFHVGADNKISESVWEKGSWNFPSTVGNEPVIPGAKLAVSSLKYLNYHKIHLFSTGPVNAVTQRTYDLDSGPWAKHPLHIDFGAFNMPAKTSSGSIHPVAPTLGGRPAGPGILGP
ncbi:hypothetical protein ABW20_dc0100183 [Dactylellina cionopaga]|nr:hypothetical protein ABW20_dc0100183 [Dactylellina cionopaga]